MKYHFKKFSESEKNTIDKIVGDFNIFLNMSEDDNV